MVFRGRRPPGLRRIADCGKRRLPPITQPDFAMKRPLFAAAAAVILSGCTASLASSNIASSTASPASYSVAVSAARGLTAEEKQVITESLSEHIREPAKYLWAPFPAKAAANGKAHYCAAVNAKSPHPPYNGLQAYLVQVQISNGQIVSSVVGSIAGGKDVRIVRKLCAKHGLNPDDAV
jgi:hypothetical protein